MPTISRFEESRNRLPESPPATDIAPERFGKDAAALSQLGGQIGQVGSKLLEVRKRAVESDAVASAYTESMLEFSKIDDEERAAYQKHLAENPGKAVDIYGVSERTSQRMNKFIQERAKGMPTGDAQADYLQRIESVSTRFSLGSQDWENKTRANAIMANMDARANIVSQDLMKSPSLAKTIDHIKGLNADIDSKTGTVLDQESAIKAKKGLGKQYALSLFDGLAAGTEADSAYGRQLLKQLPHEVAEYLDSRDVSAIENRFDQADRERRVQKSLDEQAQKDALKVRQDNLERAINADIYSGKSNVKDILHGKGRELDPDKQRELIRVLEARQREPKQASEEVMRSMISRIHADDDDPTRITDKSQIVSEYLSGGMTWAQKEHAEREFDERMTMPGQVQSEMKKQLYKLAEKSLMSGDDDADGRARIAKFVSYAENEIMEAKKRGESPRELLDANSPKYLGKQIRGYHKPPQEVFKATVQKMKAQAAQPVAPKGQILMIRPDGQRGYVPEAQAEKARAKGYKDIQAPKEQPKKKGVMSGVLDALGIDESGNAKGGGRSPQSIGKPQAYGFDAVSVLESYYGGYKSEEEMVQAIVRNSAFTPEERVQVLQEVEKDLKDNNYELSADELRRLKAQVEDEIDRAEDERPKTKEEKAILEKNAAASKKDEGKAKGKLPGELKTRKMTKEEEKAYKKQKDQW